MKRKVNRSMKGRILAVGLVAALTLPSAAARIVYDFETGDLQGWQVTKGAFARPVTDLANEHNAGRPYTKGGRFFLSTLENAENRPDDGQTGEIESPTIRLTGPAVSFKIGGGRQASLELVDRATGRTIVSATGTNGETMRTIAWNVPQAVGKDVYFRVTDAATGGWGHVTVDDVTCEGERGASDFAARPPRPSPIAEYIRSVERPGAKAAAKAALASVPEVVYVTHATFRPDHHNTATLFQCGEVNEGSYCTQGALKAWNPATGLTRVIVPEKKGRTVRDPEVDWDGRRIVFSMRDGREGFYHIYVVNADGTGLRQLTRARGVSDIDPAFLPDGDIVFSSTRDPKYCMCNRHIMCNLYRMEPDGANIHQIGASTLFEGHSSVLPDGRVLYDRWEYVDRDFGDAQGLWTCNPDGTRHAIWWGNNTTSPGGVINARAVGGDSSKVIAVLGSCHDRPWGALGLIDRSLGVDGREPVLRTWPASYRDRIHAGGNEDFDSTRSLVCKYADPFPIDGRSFLAVRQNGRGSEEMALVYLDLDGNETELLADAPGIWSPVILRPTKRPVIQSRQRNFDAPDAPGRFYLQNVCVGTHMKGVKPGTVKALRIVESPSKRSWTAPRGWFGHGEQAAAMNWHSFENKRILGTVPVEADGSAYFEVPGNTFVYFQALDAEGKMVQSMRSGAYVQPGETYGCVGCHEKRVGEAAPPAERPLAMSRAPSKMDGWHGPARLFSFQREVQPVFTKNCLSCHDYGGKAAGRLNLSGDRGAFFSTSYVDLWATGAIKCIGGGPAEIQQAYSWGAHASKLTRKLYGHGRVQFTDEERDRVVTWMDINAPYYPRYECAYPDNPGGRMPLSFAEKERLERLCGTKLEDSHSKRQRELLDFDRPESSRILENVQGDARAEALDIIRKGAERLKALPRGDVEEGFTPCARDVEREARSACRRAAERNVYEAIRTGRKVYDQ